MSAALAISDLEVTYPGAPPVRALDRINLTLPRGECFGVLGESGSGKSTLASVLLGLVPAASVSGRVQLAGLDLRALDEDGWRPVRWRRIALAFQSPSSLNPVLTVGDQLAEPLRTRHGTSARGASARVAELLDLVSLGGWAVGRYPGELSGGQRRLVLIAMALACDPDVLVLDEPTAGLDAVTRAQVLDLLASLTAARHQTLLILSHDPDALAAVADRVAVLYRGWLAEVGPAGAVVHDPRHPYSVGLLNARPTLGAVKEVRGIRGDPPDPTEVAVGCPFLGRCTQGDDSCAAARPPLVAPRGEAGPREVSCVKGGLQTILSARGLDKTYEIPSGLVGHTRVSAARDVDVDVREGEVIGIVGPTGSGKSTVAKMLALLLKADRGSVFFEGRDLVTSDRKDLRAARRRLQLLFQDPYEALSARLTVRQLVREPLDAQHVGETGERDALVSSALAEVRLPISPGFLRRHTHELSGGQLQRVALARALILQPKLLVADEPVAMLDASEQTKVLQLLKTLQIDRGMAMVLISHDLALVLRVADRVLVLHEGQVVEEGTGTQLLFSPQHPVTVALLEASGRQQLFRDEPEAP